MPDPTSTKTVQGTTNGFITYDSDTDENPLAKKLLSSKGASVHTCVHAHNNRPLNWMVQASTSSSLSFRAPQRLGLAASERLSAPSRCATPPTPQG